MNELDAVVIAAAVVAAGLGTIRWARVAQREHYLVGSVTRFVWRWWALGPVEASTALVALGATVGSGFVPGVGLATAVVVGLGPRRLGLRGRSAPLRWTRRMRTVVAIECALVGAVLGGVGATLGLAASATAAVCCAFGVPLLLECALIADAPIERAIARRFVRGARARLEQIAPVVVAITGSYGKTSTKRYLEHLLSASKRVAASPRSFNNQAGLARAVNEVLAPGTEVFIAEMGTYGSGEIAAMTRWLRPKIAAITAIGPVHLERFRSLQHTLAAKREIFLTVDTAVLNIDDAYLGPLASELRAAGLRVVACSTRSPDADVAVIGVDGAVEVRAGGRSLGEVRTDRGAPLAWSNVACALGLACAIGLDIGALVDRVRSLAPVEHRLAVSESPNGVLVLDDTYNANPTGAQMALRALIDSGGAGGRRVVVTPGMVELGAVQREENERFAEEIARVGAELVVVGWTNRKALLSGARANGSPPVTVTNREEAVAWVRGHLGPGDVVLYENDLPDHYP
jgi:UDP-N-acetylmuramoyl-tripeptide--D-alanyl-D-alanine ligase